MCKKSFSENFSSAFICIFHFIYPKTAVHILPIALLRQTKFPKDKIAEKPHLNPKNIKPLAIDTNNHLNSKILQS